MITRLEERELLHNQFKRNKPTILNLQNKHTILNLHAMNNIALIHSKKVLHNEKENYIRLQNTERY